MSSLTEHVARHSRSYRTGIVIAVSYVLAIGTAFAGLLDVATFILAAGIAHFVFGSAVEEARRRDAAEEVLNAWSDAAKEPVGGIDSAAHDWWEPSVGKPMRRQGGAAVEQARNAGV